MSTYICKCERRVKKSTNADNTGNRLEGYGPGHECYGCPYVLSWGNYEWNEETKSLERKAKGYECRMSKTLSYASQFIGSTKNKCTCSVVSLDFDFLEQISAWVKETFTLGELTGYFSRDAIRATDYRFDGCYQYTLCCAGNKSGVAAKAALFGQFFNPDGSRKDMTPQQEMEKVLADIKKATQGKEELECSMMDSAAPSGSAGASFVTGGAPLTTGTRLMTKPAHSAPQDKTPTSFPMNSPSAPTFDFGADDQTNALLLQDAQTFITGNMARIMAAKHAHDLTANHYMGSWGKWCAAVGISRDTGDRMVSVAAQCGNIQLEGKSILDVQPMKLLYAAAKPSTPEVVKQAVFSGDITTYKEYQDLMAQFKAEKDRADAAEAREEEAWKLQSKSEAKAKDAETELEAVTADLNGLYDRAAQAEARNTALLDERDEHVRRIKELENRPIEVMHDPEETDRLAHQYAYGIAADMTEELRTKTNQQSQTIAALQKELEEARNTNGYDPQSDLETVCSCIGSMEQTWGAALPAYERLTGKNLRTATDTLQDVIGRLYADMARTAEDGEA